jgi:hypothetical protein
MKRNVAVGVLLLCASLFTPIAQAGDKIATPDVKVKPKPEPQKQAPPETKAKPKPEPRKEDPPKKCHQECTTAMECGPITYERRCVDGNCFDFPRQHCSPKQVCTTVCN